LESPFATAEPPVQAQRRAGVKRLVVGDDPDGREPPC